MDENMVQHALDVDFTDDEREQLRVINERFIHEREMCMEDFERKMARIQDDHAKFAARLKRLYEAGLMFCPVCNGTGDNPDVLVGSVKDIRCRRCAGSGEIPRDR